MAIPTVITDLSATIASNPPAGGDQAFPNIDDYLRAAYGFIRQGDTKASDVASAGTTDLGSAVGRIVDVTGTTTITSFGTVAAGIWRIVRFTGALTVTHNATSLILPGAANITTAAGDTCIAVSLGSGNWVVTQYQRASGVALTLASGSWTPTLYNFSGGTVSAAYYIRVGNIVKASVKIVGTRPTGTSYFQISLPVGTANFAGNKGGGSVSVHGGAYGGIVTTLDGFSQVECSINVPTTASYTLDVEFMYEIPS